MFSFISEILFLLFGVTRQNFEMNLDSSSFELNVLNFLFLTSLTLPANGICDGLGDWCRVLGF